MIILDMRFSLKQRDFSPGLGDNLDSHIAGVFVLYTSYLDMPQEKMYFLLK
jgi:hypothetical protein